MPKIIMIIFAVTLLAITPAAQAANNNTASSTKNTDTVTNKVIESTTKVTTGTSAPATTTNTSRSLASPPPEYSVTNKNSIKIQNQGETTKLRVQTAELEILAGSESGLLDNIIPEHATAATQRSAVAQAVAELLANPNLSGGIGEQVREIARNQEENRTQITEQLNLLHQRQSLIKRIIGPDYKIIKQANQNLIRNQTQITELNTLLASLTDPEAQNAVQDMITALSEQNSELQNAVNSEDQRFSLLGWLFRRWAQ